MDQAESEREGEPRPGRAWEKIQKAGNYDRCRDGYFYRAHGNVDRARGREGQCEGMGQGEGGDDPQQVAGGFLEGGHGLPAACGAFQYAGQQEEKQEGQVVVADPDVPETLAYKGYE